MKFSKSEFASLLIVIASFFAGWYFYPALPERMASHWNAAGEVNGQMGKFWGTFLMPIVAAGMFLLFVIMPRIDPRTKNIQNFRRYFDGFIILILLFLLYLYGLTLAWNLGYSFDMVRALIPAFAVLIFCAGILIEQAQMNWTIGIRTPWTLSSEAVWKKTHKLGAQMFKASAAISLLGLLFSSVAIWLLMVPLVFSAIYLFLYSYWQFKKEKNLTNGKAF